MGRKLYRKTEQGGIRFTSQRMGHVRIPNYVYDLWLPLLGAKAIGVYGVYCRLEREGTVKAISQADIARACRIGKAALDSINEALVECGFIIMDKPDGHRRLMHWTTEITVLDPPTQISAELIERYGTESYQALSAWLVADEMTAPEDPDRSPGSPRQFPDDDPDGTSNASVPEVEILEVETQTDRDDPNNLPAEAQQVKQLAHQVDPALSGEAAIEAFDLGREYREKYDGMPTVKLKTGRGPWLAWAAESKELAPRLGVQQDHIQQVGYLLETRFGLAPPLGNRSRMKHWVNGCAELYQAADGDMDVIQEAGDAMRRDGMTLSQPQSFYNKVVALISEKRAKGAGRTGVIKVGW
jgi:hypothetical protein